MTDLRFMNEIVEDIKRLRIAYPEQTRFINELEKCVTADICDTIDAKVYIYKAKALMNALFDTIEEENFDDRCITDMQYGEVISKIKTVAVDLDISVTAYIEYLRGEYYL